MTLDACLLDDGVGGDCSSVVGFGEECEAIVAAVCISYNHFRVKKIIDYRSISIFMDPS